MIATSRRLLIAANLAAAVLLGGLSTGLTQESDGKQAAVQQPPTWLLACTSENAASGAMQCQMTQTFIRQDTKQRLMVVTILRPAGSDSLSIELLLPHGLHLPAGVSYQVDAGTKNTAAIQRSDANGSYASIPIDADLLGALKAGSTLNIGVETTARAALTVPVSLSGFTAALERLVSIR